MEKGVEKQSYVQFEKHTEYPARDAIYNWLVHKHEERGKPWTTVGWFSDELFWGTFLYHVWDWVPLLIFLYVTYWMAGWVYDHYGLFRACAFLAVMALLRINTLIRKVEFIRKRV